MNWPRVALAAALIFVAAVIVSPGGPLFGGSQNTTTN